MASCARTRKSANTTRRSESLFQKQRLNLRRLLRYAKGLEGYSRRRRTAPSGTSFEAASRRLRHYGAAGGREVRIGLPTIQPRRPKMTYLVCPDTPAVSEYATVHMAWELSKADWKLGVILPAQVDEPLRDQGRRPCGGRRQARRDPHQGGQGRPAGEDLVLLRSGLRGTLAAPLARRPGRRQPRDRCFQHRGQSAGAPGQDRPHRSRSRLGRLSSSSAGLGTCTRLQALGSPRRWARKARMRRSRSPPQGTHRPHQSHQGALARRHSTRAIDVGDRPEST